MKKRMIAMERISAEEVRKELGNSSGIMIEEDDGAVTIGYTDYDVSEFGGRDYECFYTLDKESSERFKSALSKKYTGDLFDMCVQAFTIKFSNSAFESFCKENKLEYEKKMY